MLFCYHIQPSYSFTAIKGGDFPADLRCLLMCRQMCRDTRGQFTLDHLSKKHQGQGDIIPGLSGCPV